MRPCWLVAILGIGGVCGCTTTAPGGSPEPKPAPKTPRPRPPDRPATGQGTAWFVLDWTLSRSQARLALEKAGVTVTAKRFHKTGTGYLTFRRDATKGTVYFDEKDRMASILLQWSGPGDPGVVKRARQRLGRRFGKATTAHTVVRRRWRNPLTTLTVTSIPTAARSELHLSCVSDRAPKRPVRPGPFGSVRGYSSLVWGLTPKPAAAAARKLGFSARILTKRSRHRAPNALRRSPASYRIVQLSGTSSAGDLAFDARGGLTQISIRLTFMSRAALRRRLAKLATRYGPPHTVEQTETNGWSRGGTRARLTVTTGKPHSTLRLAEEYQPIR